MDNFEKKLDSGISHMDILYLQSFSIKLPINNLAQMNYLHNGLRKLNHIDLNVFQV